MVGMPDNEAEFLAIRHAVEILRADYAQRRFDEPERAVRDIAAKAHDDIERMYRTSKAPKDEHLHVSLQRILHHQENFWSSVLHRMTQGHDA